MRGRAAALPNAGYQPPARLRLDDDQCLVRFTTEDGRTSKDFDFARFPVDRELQIAFAAAFDRRTGPSGTCKAVSSALGCYHDLRSFAVHLGALPSPPQRAAELRPEHLAGYGEQHRGRRAEAQWLGAIKRALRAMDGLDDRFAAALRGTGPARDRSPTVRSYTEGEFRRIMIAARAEARMTAERSRTHRDLIERWRAGEIDQANDPGSWVLGQVLDGIERTGDVPRRHCVNGRDYPPLSLSKLGRVSELIGMVHLTWREAIPFLVLLVGLTGQNGGTIADAPAACHRPDGDAGGPATAIVELVKPRRGRRSHMPVALADLPDWLTADEASRHAVSARDELHTPFGVFLLLRELTESARRNLGTDRLFAVWTRLGYHVGRGTSPQTVGQAVAAWGQRAGLRCDPAADESEPAPLELSLPRLRLSAVQHRQQAVAHTDQVLANEYLGRDRGNITAYQQLVARVLDDQVTRAKATALMPTLTEADLVDARSRPDEVAARFGLDTTTLKRVINGELDTVLGACSDHYGGPHGPVGQPCRASFMRCLDCPCARATPQHLPIQVLVLDELDARRSELPPAEWARRFAVPHAQLSDLVGQHPTAVVEAARAKSSDADRCLVERFLARELDYS